MSVVLFISYSGAIGGAERLLVDFAAGLDGELCVACPAGALADACRAQGLRVFALPARPLRLRGDWRTAAKAAAGLFAHGREAHALVRDLDPDLALAWGMRSAVAMLLPPRVNAPVVFQHNDLLPPGQALQRLVRAAAGRAERVVALSRSIADELAIPAHVVHPGVDVDSFPMAAPATAREVLLVGAVVGWKRPDLALEAFALARRDVPDLRLRLVGAPLPGDGGGLSATLRARASQSDLAGTVEFVGAVPDARPHLARAACLLHCAEREPFGMAVLEGLASGLPVVVPHAAGPAEIADASCGILYPAGDPARAAEALAELARDPERRARLGATGRERARQQFDRPRALARYREAVMPLARPRAREEVPPGVAGATELALVTVTHNSASELHALLRSVERHLPDAHVVVVDCGSGDDSVAVARAWPGRATVLPIENVGFGQGCNRGIHEVQAPVTVLVNPDVELLDDSLRLAVAEARARDRVLAPLVLTPSGEREDSVHPPPTSAAHLLGTLLPHSISPPLLVPWRSHRPRRVGWAVGCALIGRTDTLTALGPFDERIFLYGEDLDLGLRAAQAGIETWFWPEARVLHHRAHSTHLRFGEEPVERLMRARHEVVSRRLGTLRAGLDDAAQAVTFALRLLAKRALGRPVLRERRLLAALRRARRDAP